jgi:pimeloyl-ACP methyl ester carboxylesterase
MPSEDAAATQPAESRRDRFESFDGTEIAYQVWGAPGQLPPVLLHHGFVADATVNWVLPGVVAALLQSGREVIAPDARGHGRSGKPHDPARYGEASRFWKTCISTRGCCSRSSSSAPVLLKYASE